MFSVEVMELLLDIIRLLLFMLRLCDMKGLMSRYSGKAINDEIFLWNRLECSKRWTKRKWKGSKIRIWKHKKNRIEKRVKPWDGNWRQRGASSSSAAWLTLGSWGSVSIWSLPKSQDVQLAWTAPDNQWEMLVRHSTAYCWSSHWFLNWATDLDPTKCPRTGLQSSKHH